MFARVRTKKTQGGDAKPPALTIYQGPLGEAFPTDVGDFPNDLQPLVLDYLNGEIDHRANTPEQLQSFTLFGRNIQTLQAHQTEKAARHILLHQADAVEKLVRKNPCILYNRIPEVIDPRPRKRGLPEEKNNDEKIILLRDKTLLQIAGAAGEFNYKKMKAAEKNYGIAERLSKYLPPEEVIKQLSEQFPAGADEVTKERMQTYYDALTTFANAILTIPADSKLEAYKSIIDEYRASLETAANREVTTGLIFSPQIFCDAITFFRKNAARFGGWYTSQSTLYWVIGYGSLQYLSLDVPLIRGGSHVFEYGEMPLRTLKFSDDAPDSYYNLLGVSFFMDDFGHQCLQWCGDGRKDKSRAAALSLVAGLLVSSKKIAAAKLMLRSDNQSESRCVVM